MSETAKTAPPTEAEILAGIAEAAREHLGWQGPLAPEMRLVEDLKLDSIRMLTLAVEVENRFRVCLDQEDEEGIATVGDLAATVRRKLVADGTDGADAAEGRGGVGTG